MHHTNKSCLFHPVEDAPWERGSGQRRPTAHHSSTDTRHSLIPGAAPPRSQQAVQMKGKPGVPEAGREGNPTVKNASALATQHREGLPVLHQENPDYEIPGCGKHI